MTTVRLASAEREEADNKIRKKKLETNDEPVKKRNYIRELTTLSSDRENVSNMCNIYMNVVIVRACIFRIIFSSPTPLSPLRLRGNFAAGVISPGSKNLCKYSAYRALSTLPLVHYSSFLQCRIYIIGCICRLEPK